MNTHNISNISSFSDVITATLSSRYVKHAVYVALIALIAVMLYFSHHMYISWREQNAQYAYAHIQDLFAEHKKEKSNIQFDFLIEQIDQAYQKHNSSYLAPYFLSLKAELFLQQNNKEQAAQVLSDMVQRVGHDIPGELARTKYALLLLDLGREQEGILELEKLSNSTHNQVKDIAQFYLGRYYWVSGKDEQAKQIWQTLIEEQRAHRISPSPWAYQASQLIESLE